MFVQLSKSVSSGDKLWIRVYHKERYLTVAKNYIIMYNLVSRISKRNSSSVHTLWQQPTDQNKRKEKQLTDFLSVKPLLLGVKFLLVVDEKDVKALQCNLFLFFYAS